MLPPIYPRPLLASLLLASAGLSSAAHSEPVLCGSVADEFTARAAGLERQWILQIPSGVGSWRLEQVTVGDGLVVAQTGDGGVHAIQAAREEGGLPPGTLLWSQQLGAGGGPTGAAGIGPQVVTVAHDLAISAIDRRTGTVPWDKQLGQLPGATAVPSGDWVYATVPNEGVLRLPVNPRRSAASPTPAGATKQASSRGKQPVAAASFTESLDPKTINAGGETAFAPVPLADGIAWSTTDGMFVALERTKQGWMRHELPLGDPLAAQPVARGRTLFATTGPVGAAWPATLTRIELADPLAKDKPRPGLAIAWRVALTDHPEGSPIVAGDTIIVSLGPSGIAAFSAATGDLLWQTELVGRLVAAGGDRVWLVDETGRLSGLDLASGIRRARLCLAGLSLPVINTASDAVVLAAPGGVVLSFAPVAQPTPAER
ncbi:MAG: PQQ-binding-like beta-propeller repeat protein [Pirellulales bacterium]